MRARLCGLALLALGSVVQAGRDGDVLYQVATIDALLVGLYEGVADLAEVTAQGDFGLGTFDGLDGEMILLEGKVYRAAVDGSVHLMPPDTRTPFAAVTHFDADRRFEIPGALDYSAFKAWLEARLPSRNIVYAIRVHGRFSEILFRSVPRQRRPFPPLAQVIKQQREFQRRDIAGTLVGFWCPTFTAGVNVPGFHLHFLSEDRRHAGHVLDFSLSQGVVALDLTNGWEVRLPLAKGFLEADLRADRTYAADDSERDRKPRPHPGED